jgi:uncharacterized protein YkwD
VPPASAIAPPDVVAAAATSVCDAGTNDVVVAMNRDRNASGLAGLCSNAQLNAIAQQWADHLAQTDGFSHQDLWSVVDATPFRAMAENLLRGPSVITTDQMEAAWMASPGHREHILDATYLAVGVGIARGADDRVYAVVEFGGLLR